MPPEALIVAGPNGAGKTTFAEEYVAACMARVEERVRKGGHDVPKKDIVRRFYRSKRNFWNVYRQKTNRWQLFYNASEGFRLVASGQRDAYAVKQKHLFELFLRDLEDEAGHAGS